MLLALFQKVYRGFIASRNRPEPAKRLMLLALFQKVYAGFVQAGTDQNQAKRLMLLALFQKVYRGFIASRNRPEPAKRLMLLALFQKVYAGFVQAGTDQNRDRLFLKAGSPADLTLGMRQPLIQLIKFRVYRLRNLVELIVHPDRRLRALPLMMR